jgi:hypothetical protein
MKTAIAKTEYFKLGKMTVLCLITLDNGYEILGTATKTIIAETDEAEARGIAYQRAIYKKMELESIPQTRTIGVMPNSF